MTSGTAPISSRSPRVTSGCGTPATPRSLPRSSALVGSTTPIGAILGDGDLVAVVGTASRGPRPSPAATRLIWLIRLEGGQMAEMWTYRDTSK